MKKRLTAWMLIALMFLPALPVTTFAANTTSPPALVVEDSLEELDPEDEATATDCGCMLEGEDSTECTCDVCGCSSGGGGGIVIPVCDAITAEEMQAIMDDAMAKLLEKAVIETEMVDVVNWGWSAPLEELETFTSTHNFNRLFDIVSYDGYRPKSVQQLIDEKFAHSSDDIKRAINTLGNAMPIAQSGYVLSLNGGRGSGKDEVLPVHQYRSLMLMALYKAVGAEKYTRPLYVALPGYKVDGATPEFVSPTMSSLFSYMPSYDPKWNEYKLRNNGSTMYLLSNSNYLEAYMVAAVNDGFIAQTEWDPVLAEGINTYYLNKADYWYPAIVNLKGDPLYGDDAERHMLPTERFIFSKPTPALQDLFGTMYDITLENDVLKVGLRSGLVEGKLTNVGLQRESYTLLEFAEMAARMMYLYGEETASEEDLQLLRYKYGGQFPSDVTYDQKEAFYYLIAKGVLPQSILSLSLQQPMTLDDCFLYLSRIADVGSRLKYFVEMTEQEFELAGLGMTVLNTVNDVPAATYTVESTNLNEYRDVLIEQVAFRRVTTNEVFDDIAFARRMSETDEEPAGAWSLWHGTRMPDKTVAGVAYWHFRVKQESIGEGYEYAVMPLNTTATAAVVDAEPRCVFLGVVKVVNPDTEKEKKVLEAGVPQGVFRLAEKAIDGYLPTISESFEDRTTKRLIALGYKNIDAYKDQIATGVVDYELDLFYSCVDNLGTAIDNAGFKVYSSGSGFTITYKIPLPTGGGMLQVPRQTDYNINGTFVTVYRRNDDLTNPLYGAFDKWPGADNTNKEQGLVVAYSARPVPYICEAELLPSEDKTWYGWKAVFDGRQESIVDFTMPTNSGVILDYKPNPNAVSQRVRVYWNNAIDRGPDSIYAGLYTGYSGYTLSETSEYIGRPFLLVNTANVVVAGLDILSSSDGLTMTERVEGDLPVRAVNTILPVSAYEAPRYTVMQLNTATTDLSMSDVYKQNNELFVRSDWLEEEYGIRVVLLEDEQINRTRLQLVNQATGADVTLYGNLGLAVAGASVQRFNLVESGSLYYKTASNVYLIDARCLATVLGYTLSALRVTRMDDSSYSASIVTSYTKPEYFKEDVALYTARNTTLGKTTWRTIDGNPAVLLNAFPSGAATTMVVNDWVRGVHFIASSKPVVPNLSLSDKIKANHQRANQELFLTLGDLMGSIPDDQYCFAYYDKDEEIAKSSTSQGRLIFDQTTGEVWQVLPTRGNTQADEGDAKGKQLLTSFETFTSSIVKTAWESSVPTILDSTKADVWKTQYAKTKTGVANDMFHTFYLNYYMNTLPTLYYSQAVYPEAGNVRDKWVRVYNPPVYVANFLDGTAGIISDVISREQAVAYGYAKPPAGNNVDVEQSGIQANVYYQYKWTHAFGASYYKEETLYFKPVFNQALPNSMYGGATALHTIYDAGLRFMDYKTSLAQPVGLFSILHGYHEIEVSKIEAGSKLYIDGIILTLVATDQNFNHGTGDDKRFKGLAAWEVTGYKHDYDNYRTAVVDENYDPSVYYRYYYSAKSEEVEKAHKESQSNLRMANYYSIQAVRNSKWLIGSADDNVVLKAPYVGATTLYVAFPDMKLSTRVIPLQSADATGATIYIPVANVLDLNIDADAKGNVESSLEELVTTAKTTLNAIRESLDAALARFEFRLQDLDVGLQILYIAALQILPRIFLGSLFLVMSMSLVADTSLYRRFCALHVDPIKIFSFGLTDSSHVNKVQIWLSGLIGASLLIVVSRGGATAVIIHFLDQFIKILSRLTS